MLTMKHEDVHKATYIEEKTTKNSNHTIQLLARIAPSAQRTLCSATNLMLPV